MQIAFNFKEERAEGSPSASLRLLLVLTGSSEGLSLQATHQTLGPPARLQRGGPQEVG